MCSNCDKGLKPQAPVWWRTSTKDQAELSPATQIKDAGATLGDAG